MKTNHVTFASLVLATACATTVTPHAFFAKINGTLVSLQINNTESIFQKFIWGKSLAKASEFVYDDGRALSSNPSKPGYADIDKCAGFYFHELSAGTVLKFDGQKRLTNSFFYSCEEYDGLNSIHTKKKYPQCSYVEIYFLQYDKTTNAPVKGSYTAEEQDEKVPHVFFIKGKQGLEPLYSETFECNEQGLVSFNHGNSSVKPLEFLFRDDYALIEDAGPNSGYVGFTFDYFGYGRSPRRTNLGLDGNKQFSDRRFFSCKTPGSSNRVIALNPRTEMDCFEVDMHLLPYNRTSGRPMEGSYVEKKEDEEPKSVFFIKANNTLEPLLCQKARDIWMGRPYGIFYHQKSSAKPVEFTMKNKIALTQDSSIAGFAGLIYKKFVFGGYTSQTPFDLGKDFKINGHRILSCAKDTDHSIREIIFDSSSSGACSEVEIYLLPYNRTCGCPVEGSYVPDENNERTDSSSSPE